MDYVYISIQITNTYAITPPCIFVSAQRTPIICMKVIQTCVILVFTVPVDEPVCPGQLLQRPQVLILRIGRLDDSNHRKRHDHISIDGVLLPEPHRNAKDLESEERFECLIDDQYREGLCVNVQLILPISDQAPKAFIQPAHLVECVLSSLNPHVMDVLEAATDIELLAHPCLLTMTVPKPLVPRKS